MNKKNNRRRAFNNSPYENFEKIRSKERRGYQEDDYDRQKQNSRVVIDKNNFKCASMRGFGYFRPVRIRC